MLLALHAIRLPRRPDRVRRRRERRVRVACALGLGVPLALGAWAWRTPGFDGLLLHSGAAALGTVLITAMFMAILASSLVDWYHIVLAAFGSFGSPMWMTDAEASDGGRGRWKGRSR